MPVVSIWTNSSQQARRQYGIRIGAHRDRLLVPRPTALTIELEGGATFTKPLSKAFWHQCPEIRDESVRIWLKDQNLLLWPPGKPPRFRFELVSSERLKIFRGNVRT